MVDERGEPVQLDGAGIELALHRGLVDGVEDVTRPQLAMPAAEAIDVLFFFVELGQGELLVADLLRERSETLAALGLELDPFGAPGLVVQVAPRRVKLAVAIAAVWVLSPIDLIPEFLPVIGPLDDIVVVALALRYAARRVPPAALVEAWPAERRILSRLAPSTASITTGAH